MKAPLKPIVAAPFRPDRAAAEDAVRTLIRWAGDDPDREGLLDTPKRVARAYEEWFAGYGEDPVDLLARTFEETEGYDEMVVLKDVRFESFCEHHLAPILGTVDVAYLPNSRVVGISKIARVSPDGRADCRRSRGTRGASPRCRETRPACARSPS